VYSITRYSILSNNKLFQNWGVNQGFNIAKNKLRWGFSSKAQKVEVLPRPEEPKWGLSFWGEAASPYWYGVGECC